ncbi:hypothetical protein CICLE_v10007294mg [Citrus x clementina]|uniref:AAA+ ATPase domain-containing protein n=1 Tax=Citrus clementina TaxID=85681 RepID=V4USM8_CITCL|nr:disease resistance protein RPS2-like isoform X2 [Citrus sinensis]ESR65541.1 hypothetical protein CICLE_v10007294mg [Citrus x clementina]
MCWAWILANIVTPVASRTVDGLGNRVEEQIGYLLDYDDNLEGFRTRAGQLEARKNDVLGQVDKARDNNEKIKEAVLLWLAKAIQIEIDKEMMEEKIEKNKGPCHTWQLDWRFRCQLSELAKDKITKIDELMASRDIHSVSDLTQSADLGDLATPDYVPLESSSKALNSIMKLLKDDKVNIIGLQGPGGIGKSTLMEQLAKQIDTIAPHDKAHVIVAESSDLRRIQDKIAELLKFKIEEEDELQRRATLAKRLRERTKKVLIILDDVREKINLAVSGIPYGEERKRCKVIVTSRRLDVCSKMSDVTVQIEELGEEDRLKLFKQIARLPDSEAFEGAAKVIVKACGSLPNAIAIVAGALRGKLANESNESLVNIWNDAVEEVIRESRDIKIEEIPKEEFLGITIGYNELKMVAKGCLQFCCLFPAYRSVPIEDFVMHGLVDRLFRDVDSMGGVLNKMQSIVEDLRNRKILSYREGEGTYRIHDNTRIVVKYFATKEGNNLKSEAGLKKGWPQEDLKEYKKISLMDSGINKLPDEPMCPQLLTLFLQHNAFDKIPPGFFEHMREINFLDLSYTNISTLPGSIECLVKLRSLRAENTHLEKAPLKKEFKELVILILRGSSIRELPKGLERWINLKLLDLSNNIFLQGIPPNIISKLCQLEELYIGNSFGNWELEETPNPKSAAFKEVASLSRLTVLYIHINSTEVLSKQFDGPWGNLKRFRVQVNDDYWEIASTRSMHLKNISTPLADWVKLLLEKTEDLTLTRSRDLEDIGAIEVQGLTALMTMHLRACSLQRIFRSSFYARARNAEELNVEYCYSMKEVFCLEENEIEEEQAGLRKLRELILEGLPKLLTIWKGNHSKAHVENLEIMRVKECGKLKNIFSKTLALKLGKLEQLSFQKCDRLEEIVSSDEPEEKPEAAVSNIPPPPIFQNLQKLIISKCHKMKSVFSLTIVKGLKELKELNIVGCNEMERIISVSDEERKEERADILIQLENLILEDLTELKTIYNGKEILEWAGLERLQVRNCPNVKRLPMDASSAPKLVEVRAETQWLEALEWEDDDDYCKGRLLSLAQKSALQKMDDI